MKKLLKFSLSVLMATLVASSAMMASAEETFKSIWDYNNLPTGFKPGSDEDKGSQGQPYLNFPKGLGTEFTATVDSGVGINGGKGLVIHIFNNQGWGEWDTWDTYTSRALHPVTNVVGATDFMVWFDLSKWKNYKTEPFKYYMDFGDYDCDKNGKLTGNFTTWQTGLTGKKTPCYFQDGKGGWKQGIIDEQNFIEFPPYYKGWVKIPLSSCGKPSWGNYDVDNKFDGVCVNFVGCGATWFSPFNGNTMVIANYGFLGNFASGGIPLPMDKGTMGVSTPSKSSSSKSATSVVKIASGAGTPAVSSQPGMAASSAVSSSSIVSEAISSLSETISQDESSTAGSSSTAAAATKQHTSSIVLWIILGIVILAAAAGSIFFVIKRKK